jgi:hypothetical protein
LFVADACVREPIRVTTCTFTVPARTFFGVLTVNLPLDFTDRCVPFALPNITRTTWRKPEPFNVTVTPPLAGPAFAEIDVTVSDAFFVAGFFAAIAAVVLAPDNCFADDTSGEAGSGVGGSCWVALVECPT